MGFDRAPGLPDIGNVINVDPETGHNPHSKDQLYPRVAHNRDAALTAQAGVIQRQEAPTFQACRKAVFSRGQRSEN